MLFNLMSLQFRVPEYPTVRPDGSLWRYGCIKPVEGYLQYLKDLTPPPPNENSASDWSDDESDNVSTEAQRDSEEDLAAGPVEGIDPVDNNNNVVLVNGPNPDCSLGEA